jgi:hypothetical protein
MRALLLLSRCEPRVRGTGDTGAAHDPGAPAPRFPVASWRMNCLHDRALPPQGANRRAISLRTGACDASRAVTAFLMLV